MNDPKAEEREHLLRSLDDLDREHAAGDLDEHDYEALRADYTTRMAGILRQVENETVERLAFPSAKARTSFKRASTRASHLSSYPNVPDHPIDNPSNNPTDTDNSDRTNDSELGKPSENPFVAASQIRLKPSAAGRVGVALGVLGVAVGSGFAVAQFAGERVGSTGLTGTVRQAASPEQQKVQALMQTGRDNLGSDPLKSLQAFDAALKIDPELPEAMAYSGWVLRIASLSAEGTDADGLRAGAIRRIDQAILADPTYPDAYAFKGVIALRDQDDPKTALAAFKKLDGLQTPPFVQQLVDSARKEAEEALGIAPATTDSTSNSTADSSPGETPAQTSIAG
jgi:tetratricopeptide (TPR) repeat protein